jgi:hypothetical protein
MATSLLSRVSKSKESPEIAYSKNSKDFEDLYRKIIASKENSIDSMLYIYNSMSDDLDKNQAERVRNIFSVFVTKNLKPKEANKILVKIYIRDTEKQIARERNATNITIAKGAMATVLTGLFGLIVREHIREKNRPVNFWEKKFWE